MNTSLPTSTCDESAVSRTLANESIRWSVRLLAKEPRKVTVIFFAAFAAAGLGYFLFHRGLMGLIGFAMILGSTAEHWVGSSYALDIRGVQARTVASVTAMEWGQVKRVSIGRNTLRISPLPQAGKMEPFRGVLLRTTPANRDQILEFIRSHVPEGTTFENAQTEEG